MRPGAPILLAAALLPAAAHAVDGDLPRTPVIHLGERCMTVVDRSVEHVVRLDYTIPIVDLCVTADELPQSRTHQMIAFCHGDPSARILPHWLTRDEAEASAAASARVLGDDPEPVPASDILSEHPDYTDCWTPILTAEQRRPITCASARPGVDWDTTDLAQGAYFVRGYTYQPPLNFWSERKGVFKIVDGPDPADAPPAVAFAHGDIYLWKNEPMTLHLCVDAMDGSTLTLSHALSLREVDPVMQWTAFVSDEPVMSGSVELEFLPPPELANNFLSLRAEIVDPNDRRGTAYLQGFLKIDKNEDPSASATTGDTESDTTEPDGTTTYPVPYDFCAKNPNADTPPECPDPTTGATTGATTSPADDGGGDGGCCSIHAAPSPAALIVLLALRRRRRNS